MGKRLALAGRFFLYAAMEFGDHFNVPDYVVEGHHALSQSNHNWHRRDSQFG
jgi:hypothetical protein